MDLESENDSSSDQIDSEDDSDSGCVHSNVIYRSREEEEGRQKSSDSCKMGCMYGHFFKNSHWER